MAETPQFSQGELMPLNARLGSVFGVVPSGHGGQPRSSGSSVFIGWLTHPVATYVSGPPWRSSGRFGPPAREAVLEFYDVWLGPVAWSGLYIVSGVLKHRFVGRPCYYSLCRIATRPFSDWRTACLFVSA